MLFYIYIYIYDFMRFNVLIEIVYITFMWINKMIEKIV